MALSPDLDRFLADMEYPATRDDLLREAFRDGLDPHERALLASLPEQNYSAAWHLRYRLALQAFDEAPTPATALVT